MIRAVLYAISAFGLLAMLPVAFSILGAEWAKDQPKEAVGLLAKVSVEQSMWGAETTLTLEDGTQIRLDGKFNWVKAGMPVEMPVEDGPYRKTYLCLKDTCLPIAE